MAVREWMNEHSRAATAVAAVLLIGGLMILGWNSLGSREIKSSNQLLYSIDDGKTWFADSADKLPPFDHQGKPAYQVYVWSCDGGATKFVSHLVRYTPAGRKRMLEQKQRGPAAGPTALGVGFSDTEVKRPGAPDTEWVRASDMRAGDIMMPKCPDGGGGTPEMITP